MFANRQAVFWMLEWAVQGEEEARSQERWGGKICNALFKAKQTYPDMPALRFWKPGWKEWGKPQCGCQEPFEGWRRPWIAKRMFREEESVGNSTVASDAFIACCIEVIEHFPSLVIPYLQLTFISRSQGWELAKAVTLPSPPTRCLTHGCLINTLWPWKTSPMQWEWGVDEG